MYIHFTFNYFKIYFLKLYYFMLFVYLFINCVILTKNVKYQFNTKYSNNIITLNQVNAQIC